MKTENMITLAVHSGKKEYVPLLENLFKSFLICNSYPSIEVILLETAGNKEVREWFSSINFSDFFSNFDGQKTSIKKQNGVSIKKTLLF